MTSYKREFDEEKEMCKRDKGCAVLVNEEVCVEANVKIDPKVHVGKVRAFCEEPMIGKCCGHECCEPCEFVVSQTFCVEIPIALDAEIDVDPSGHVCERPKFGPCRKCRKTYEDED